MVSGTDSIIANHQTSRCTLFKQVRQHQYQAEHPQHREKKVGTISFLLNILPE
jgi:hypothetical protein